MISKSILLSALALSAVPTASAADATLSVGKFVPDDGVLTSLYDDDRPSFTLAIGAPQGNGLSWYTSLFGYAFKSQVANLQNSIMLASLTTGFRQSFPHTPIDDKTHVEPFFGAQAGYAAASIRGRNTATAVNGARHAVHGFAALWEVGATITGVAGPLSLDLSLADITIAKKLYGGVSLSGRMYALGFHLDL